MSCNTAQFQVCHVKMTTNEITGKNNRFSVLDILGYLKNTHKNPKLGIPWLGLVSLCQIWDFYWYSLNTLKYPKMGICYFFL